jgi:hypothetical protein
MTIAILAGRRLGFGAREVVLLVPIVGLSFALAGAVAGALWPWRRTWRGALVLGYAAAGILYASVMLIVVGWFSRWGPAERFAFGFATIAMGTCFAYLARKD